MKTPLLLAFLSVCSAALSDDVHLEWMTKGISSALRFYRPMPLTLTGDKPANVTKQPDGLKNPMYGTLKIGPAESPSSVVFLLDEPEAGDARLWVDENGNGDLTDDPAVPWKARTTPDKLVSYAGSASVMVSDGKLKRSLGLEMYRFDKKDPKRQSLRDKLFYYRNYGLRGEVTIGGKSYKAVLSDESVTGDLRGGKLSASSLLLDLNNDGNFSTKGEMFDVRKPFNVDGVTYEVAGLTALGDSFEIKKSSQKVEAVYVPPPLGIGAKAVGFEDKTLDGKAVNFPADYKGKLVMLDFWATWCGPCRAELPNLKKVYEEFHDKGFEVLGISLDNEESIKQLAKFTADNQMPWPQVCDGKGWESRIAGLYGVHAIPACWLIDGSTGEIVATASTLRGAALRDSVQSALAKLGKPTTASTPGKGMEPKPESKPRVENPLIPIIEKARVANKVISADAFIASMKAPSKGAVALLPPDTKPLRGREIAERAAQAYVRVGWMYKCTRCNNTHVSVAGGYAISQDVVATAWHVLQAPERMRQGEGWPVVIRGEDEVIKIDSVIAGSESMDAILVRVKANDLEPLPLASDVRIGDDAFCLSDPRGTRGYFSNGIVNRFFVRDGGKAGDPNSERLHVSTDWAPGSSGSAVLDGYGNAIGHVARIQSLFGDKKTAPADDSHDQPVPTLMTLHEAIPARSVLTLLSK